MDSAVWRIVVYSTVLKYKNRVPRKNVHMDVYVYNFTAKSMFIWWIKKYDAFRDWVRWWEKFQSLARENHHHCNWLQQQRLGSLLLLLLSFLCILLSKHHIHSFKDQGPFWTPFSIPQCRYLEIVSDFVPWREFIAILLICLILLVTVRFVYLNVGG